MSFCSSVKERVAVWVALFLFQLYATDVVALCSLPAGAEKVAVRQVFDGDTLELKDGRRIRFIGVNTPELAHRQRLEEPLAKAAKKFTQDFVYRSAFLYLQVGQEKYDHYGRTLGHLFNDKGQSLEEALLLAGWAFPVFFPPNLSLSGCLSEAALQARQQRKGVWGIDFYKPTSARDVGSIKPGFGRFEGVVERAYLKKGRTWWIPLQGVVVIRIAKQFHPYFSVKKLRQLEGNKVEVSGWLVKRKLTNKQKRRGYKPYMLSIRHPNMMIP